jgi:hypothetical protein
VLAGGGSLALFWNFDRIIDDAVQEEVTQAHRDLTPHISWDTAAMPEDGLLGRWPATEIAGLAAFTGLEARLYRWERVLSRRQYVQYLATHSPYLILDPAARDELFARIASILPARVPLAEDTVLYLARRTPSNPVPPADRSR